ncbi:MULTISPECIES: ribosomal protection-like ABC-F family protein [Bacillus]|uniref:ribosomal protection-like ABC-F family protein n=1 Tax=Bacillus TaxID=1386 RepID=UPI0020A015D7|nr:MULTISPECIES: ABC-F family ATP-binding cassette domain-containing protein [Bacillus]MCP1157206.1 ABC-F family ATP-binding cassette domain-containing protein [Bacillus infantis]MDT0162888.1 ABC-F family ATP-binding cassette domain-containing protein [Bacillus sp. AG4(2022)]
MLELKLNGIKKYMEATLIMRNVSIEAFEGEKIGIVGANGCGKSTILKLIAGIEKMHYYPGYPQTSSPGYDEGLIHFPRGASKAYLEQSPVFPPGLTVNDVLNLAFEEIDEIEARMRELEEQMKVLTDKELEKALNQYSDLVMQLEAKGGYEREEKLGKVCTGLKFSESFLNTNFDLLSGGEKTTVVLGKLLIHNPDILLLDEPTNHLDMEAIEWLESYLKSCRGIVLIVSHDRYFLDRTVTKIVEIEDMESITYKGNYSSFISQKEENMRIQYEHFREQQKKINGMEKTVSDLREWAMRADNNKFFRRAASIQKKLDKMDIIEKPVFKRRNMRLDIKAAQRSGKEVIKADGLCKSFNDKVIFKNSVLLVQYGERVGLLGSNGSGKTTFLKMLLGEVLPDGGTVELGANVQAAYLPQKIVFNDEELTVLEAFREDISIVEGKAREYLAKFMFYKKSVFTKVKQLSGGERIRLKLAMLLYQDINLLILDEPTNHLDIPSIETLEAALEDFEGTIFFISHDRYFINRISERVVAVEDYSLKNYPGNYDSYKMIKEQKAVQVMPVPEEKKKNQHSYAKQDTSAEKAEARIQRLEQELKEIDAFMAEAGSDYDRLNLLYGRKEKLNKELEEAIGLWLG